MDISTTTVLVALVSGAAGAILGKWLEGHFQRERDFRTWHLEAAADYTTGVHQALLALSACYNTMLKYGGARADGHIEIRNPATREVLPEIAKSLDYVHERVDDTHSRLGRVHILFGSKSRTGSNASEAIKSLRQAEQALDDWPVPDVVTYKSAFGAAHETHEEFNDAALDTLKRPPRYRRIRGSGRGTETPNEA